MFNKLENLIPKLLYLAIITTIVIPTFSLSKFESAIAGSTDVSVASFVIDANGKNEDLIIDCNAETPTTSYDVVVTNKKDNKISGVAIKYDIVFEFNTPLPSGITISNGITTLTTNENQTIYTFSDVGTLLPGVEDIKIHTITFTGNNSILTDYNDTLSIYVDAVQID